MGASYSVVACWAVNLWNRIQYQVTKGNADSQATLPGRRYFLYYSQYPPAILAEGEDSVVQLLIYYLEEIKSLAKDRQSTTLLKYNGSWHPNVFFKIMTHI